MHDENAICLNCEYWDIKHRMKLPIYNDHGNITGEMEVAACKRRAVLIEDAGDSLTLLAADGHCQQYGDAFRPSPDYLTFQHEAETQNDGLPVMQDDPANYGRRSHAAA